MYLANKVTIIKRNKTSLTVLILVVSSFVLATNMVSLWTIAKPLQATTQQDNSKSDDTAAKTTLDLICTNNGRPMLVQNVVLLATRVLLPFAIIFVSSIALLAHVRRSRKRVANRNATTLAAKRSSRQFTRAVCLINLMFFIFNIGYVIKIILDYSLSFSTSLVFQNSIMMLLDTAFNLMSYMFTLLQFWIDLAFNRLFRNQVKLFVRKCLGLIARIHI